MEQIKIQYAPYYNRVEQIGTEVGVRCEDRTFDEVDNESSSGREVRDDGDGKSLLPPSDNPFKPFYDQVIDPIVDMLGPQDNELVFVSDDALCLPLWGTVIETISYQLISNVPESQHKKTGAFWVGNPCLIQLKKPEPDLSCVREEAKKIASILKTRPL